MPLPEPQFNEIGANPGRAFSVTGVRVPTVEVLQKPKERGAQTNGCYRLRFYDQRLISHAQSRVSP